MAPPSSLQLMRAPTPVRGPEKATAMVGACQGDQCHRVPYYWIIWPEDRVLVAHRLDGAGYRVIATRSGVATARVPPFDAIELDLTYILGD
jgi:hypothetical protein